MFTQFINLSLASSGRTIAINVSDISTFQEYTQNNKLATLITMKSGKEIIVDERYEEIIRLIEDDDDEDWDEDEDEE